MVCSGCKKSCLTLIKAAAPPVFLAVSSSNVSVCAQTFSRAADEGLPSETVIKLVAATAVKEVRLTYPE